MKTELKRVLEEKIKEFESYKTNPNYQSEIEQNAVVITLRELKYLESIAEIVVDPEPAEGEKQKKSNELRDEILNILEHHLGNDALYPLLHMVESELSSLRAALDKAEGEKQSHAILFANWISMNNWFAEQTGGRWFQSLSKNKVTTEELYAIFLNQC